jgi:hypothetical protein
MKPVLGLTRLDPKYVMMVVVVVVVVVVMADDCISVLVDEDGELGIVP